MDNTYTLDKLGISGSFNAYMINCGEKNQPTRILLSDNNARHDVAMMMAGTMAVSPQRTDLGLIDPDGRLKSLKSMGEGLQADFLTRALNKEPPRPGAPDSPALQRRAVDHANDFCFGAS